MGHVKCLKLCQNKLFALSAFEIQQFPKVSPEDADTYKCFATNEYGRAVCPVLLNVIEGKIMLTPTFDDIFGVAVLYFDKDYDYSIMCTVGFSRTKELQKIQGKGEVWKHHLKRDNFRYVKFLSFFILLTFFKMCFCMLAFRSLFSHFKANVHQWGEKGFSCSKKN